MASFIANDDCLVSLRDAETLIQEIDRLRGEISRLEQQINELDQLAYRDTLVDLANRRGFLANLRQLIARVERYGDDAAMLFVDVDGLKQINDQFGHCAGDAALKQVGQALASTVRDSDSVARIGGDEFAILLDRANELNAWQMALRVVESIMGSEFCVDGICLPLSVAVGVAVIRPGDTPSSVMERADREMYRLKNLDGRAAAAGTDIHP